jgi:hypothetical protein
MRIRLASLWLVLGLYSMLTVGAAQARIIKVLPHYLDKEGRHSLSPSLYERDAYQAFLREHTDKRSSLQFDVQWKAKASRASKLVLRLELRSSGRDLSQPLVLERPVRPPRLFSAWSSLRLEKEEYRQFGQLIAWRATLWQGSELLADQQSFLW